MDLKIEILQNKKSKKWCLKFMDGNGQVVYVLNGFNSEDEARNVIRKAFEDGFLINK